MTDCPICCSAFTDVARKAIQCNMCSFSACTKCVKTYLLGTIKDPHCMKCNVGWSKEFIDLSLSKAFRTGDLKKHRENILVDREKSRLPSTMPLVEAELQRRQVYKEIKQLLDEKVKLQNNIRAIDEQIYEKQTLIIQDKRRKQDNPIYQRPCPSTECRGYLSGWKCNLCGVKVCSKCHVPSQDNDDVNHVCNEDDISTAKLLEKDTKYCPNAACRAPIFKINGCSQIFCTKCHTAFDWETGVIVTNQAAIHNPHFYEYLRQQNNGNIPRNVGDVPCGGMPGVHSMYNHLKKIKLSQDLQKSIMDIHRGIQHIIHFEIPRHPINLVGGEKFTALRVRYMLKEISEEDWKQELQRIEKKNEKNLAFRQVFDMLVGVSVDMFTRITTAKDEKTVTAVTNELESLREYFNETVVKVNQRFATGYNMPKQLNDTWFYTS